MWLARSGTARSTAHTLQRPSLPRVTIVQLLNFGLFADAQTIVRTFSPRDVRRTSASASPRSALDTECSFGA
jgi:hypothetical protein